MKELYKKHRPKDFNEVVGQESAAKTLSSLISKDKIPHALLFTGPSGCGKTTLIRILAKKLKCSKMDYFERNCADFKGIDTIRDIRGSMMTAPLKGRCKIYAIDEAHKLTNDAQNAFLKILEDTPSHIYFMLATTDPQKLLKTVRTRCTEITLKAIPDKEIGRLLDEVSKKEKTPISSELKNKIINASEGSARKALVLLHQVMGIDEDDKRIEAVSSSVAETQAIQIARTLFKPKVSWKEMAEVIKGVENEDAEQIRWMILGYAKAILLNGGPLAPKAFQVIENFRDNWYDCKFAGLVAGCYAIVVGE